MILERAVIKEIKEKALVMLDEFLTKRINSDNEKNVKFAQTLSFWIIDYIKFSEYETQPQQIRYKRYKRGDVIKANFGHRIGREHGGTHYAIVIDVKNSVGSAIITVIPLTSVKENTNMDKLGRDRIYIGNEIYENLKSKAEIMGNSKEKDKVLKELKQMKRGSIALVCQITTISKYRIYDPISSKNVLHGIRVSDKVLNTIDDKIMELFIKSVDNKYI